MCVIKYYELIRALHNVITFVSYVVTMVIYTIIKNIHGTHFGHLVLNTIVCFVVWNETITECFRNQITYFYNKIWNYLQYITANITGLCNQSDNDFQFLFIIYVIKCFLNFQFNYISLLRLVQHSLVSGNFLSMVKRTDKRLNYRYLY